jgi:hypothetical protein
MRRFAGYLEPQRIQPKFLLSFAAVLIAGCHIGGLPRKPAIEITRVPLAESRRSGTIGYYRGPGNWSRTRRTGRSLCQKRRLVGAALRYANNDQSPARFDVEELDPSRHGICSSACSPGISAAIQDGYLPEPGNGVVATVTARGKAGAPIVRK